MEHRKGNDILMPATYSKGRSLISIQNCTTSRITMFAIYFCMWRGRFCQPRCKTQRELLELLSINWYMIDVLWNTINSRMPDPSISSSGCTKLTEHKILHALKFYDRPIYLRKKPVPLYVCYMISGCPCFPGTVTTTNVSGTRYGNKVSLVLADVKSHKVEIWNKWQGQPRFSNSSAKTASSHLQGKF